MGMNTDSRTRGRMTRVVGGAAAVAAWMLAALLQSACGNPAAHPAPPQGGGWPGPQGGAVVTVPGAPGAVVHGSSVVYVGSPATVDGAMSYDTDGDPLTLSWRLVDAPPGSAATLSADSGDRIAVNTDVEGDYVVELTARAGGLDSVPVYHTVVARKHTYTDSGGATRELADVPGRVTVTSGGTLELLDREGGPDTLTLTGWLNVSVVNTKLRLVFPAAVVPGAHTVIHADGGVTGTFTRFLVDGMDRHRYQAEGRVVGNDVVVTVTDIFSDDADLAVHEIAAREGVSLITAARMFVHDNSNHDTGSAWYADHSTDYPFVTATLADRYFGRSSVVADLACSQRVILLRAYLVALGYDTRAMYHHSDGQPDYGGHTTLEVFDRAGGKWQVQDPDYGLEYRDAATGEIMSMAEVVFAPDLDGFHPSSGACEAWACAHAPESFLAMAHYPEAPYENTVLLNRDRFYVTNRDFEAYYANRFPGARFLHDMATAASDPVLARF